MDYTFSIKTQRKHTKKLKGLFCSTCEIEFQDSRSHQAHYKSELHKYNLKRRIVDLPPISLDFFEKKKQGTRSPEEPENNPRNQGTETETPSDQSVQKGRVLLPGLLEALQKQEQVRRAQAVQKAPEAAEAAVEKPCSQPQSPNPRDRRGRSSQPVPLLPLPRKQLRGGLGALASAALLLLFGYKRPHS